MVIIEILAPELINPVQVFPLFSNLVMIYHFLQ